AELSFHAFSGSSKRNLPSVPQPQGIGTAGLVGEMAGDQAGFGGGGVGSFGTRWRRPRREDTTALVLRFEAAGGKGISQQVPGCRPSSSTPLIARRHNLHVSDGNFLPNMAGPASRHAAGWGSQRSDQCLDKGPLGFLLRSRCQVRLAGKQVNTVYA